MKEQNNEGRNRVIGLLSSLGFHGALLLLFLISIAGRAPGPPASEFGVLVNVGFDDQGSGDVQTDKPVETPDVKEEEPVKEEPQPQPVSENKPTKADKEETLAAEEESPVVVKKEEPKKVEPKKEEPKKVEPKKEEPKKEEPKKEPEKLLTEYKPSNATTKSNTKGGGSEGDDEGNKTGNKGQPDGTLDPNGQYSGKSGGGGGGDGGMSLNMSGWAWSEKPSTAAIPNNESGRIVFEIECDDSGEIIGIKTVERGVSPATEQLLKKELMRISLVSTIKGGVIPERSKGTVTFVVKSR